MKSNKNKQNKQSKRKANNGGVNPPSILKPFQPTIKCTHKFRFQCALSASKLDLRDIDLLYMLGVANTAVFTSPIFGSVRLRKLEMMNVNASPGTLSQLQIEYKGNNPAYGNSSVIHQSSSLSSFQYSHLVSRPPSGSYAAAWLTNSGYNLCQLTCDVGTVVDVTLEFTLLDDTPNFADPAVNAGLTQGYLYCHTLTAQHAPGVFLPIGYNQSL
jgi:hypothetical protein